MELSKASVIRAILLCLVLLSALHPLPLAHCRRGKKNHKVKKHKHGKASAKTFDLYVWAGPDDWTKGENDSMLVFRVDPRKTQAPPKMRGRLVLHSVGNEPHHMAFNKDRTFLFAGGLLSFAFGLPSIYFFKVSKTSAPQLWKTYVPVNSTACDAGLALDDGGLLVTMMGGPGGGKGGQLLIFDRNANFVTQFPPDAVDYENKTGHPLSPHGITATTDGKYFISSDFVVPSSTLPPGPVIRTGAVRVWDSHTHELHGTATAPVSQSNAMGAMDVVSVKNVAIALCTATGLLYAVDPETLAIAVTWDSGNNGSLPQLSVVNKAQNVLYVSLYGEDKVVKLNATNPWKLNLLAATQLPAGAGPHFLALSPDESILMVSDYFLDEKNVGGLVHYPGDNKVRFIRTADMVELTGMSLDFNTAVSSKVAYRPHGMSVYPL